MSQHPEERSKKTNGKSKANESAAGKSDKGTTSEVGKKGSKSTSGHK